MRRGVSSIATVEHIWSESETESQLKVTSYDSEHILRKTLQQLCSRIRIPFPAPSLMSMKKIFR